MSAPVETVSPSRLKDHHKLEDFDFEETDSGVLINAKRLGCQYLHSFVKGPIERRASQTNQALLKACNNKARSIHQVLDLTAGWGADAFVLATQGQQVTLLEKNVAIASCVDYSLSILAQSHHPTANRLELRHCDATDFLNQLSANHGFDCIYIDPMFPAHKSSAKPAKEMQILQALTDNQAIDLMFELALQKAVKRVVIKRPLKAVPLGEATVDLVYRERSVRFDIYLTN